jgi:hypothetical protein
MEYKEWDKSVKSGPRGQRLGQWSNKSVSPECKERDKRVDFFAGMWPEYLW